MPNFYATNVAEGRIIDFSTFVWMCAREFSPFEIDRENNRPFGWIPSKEDIAEIVGEDNTKLQLQIETTINLLEEMKNRSDVEWEKYRQQEEKAEKDQYLIKQQEAKTKQQRCEAMLQLVKKWRLPSQDHLNLKNFMITSLEDAIIFYEHPPPKVQYISTEEYKEKILQYEQDYLNKCLSLRSQRMFSAKAKRRWIEALLKSVKG